MVRYRDTLWCDGCGVEIRWKPIIKDQHSYCCSRCLNGEVCDCAESPEDDQSSPTPKPGSSASMRYRHLADA